MSDVLGNLGIDIAKTTDLGFDLLDKLVATARPNAVFSHPVTTGDYTVITASEVSCGMGTGFGSGGGGAPASVVSTEGEVAPPAQSASMPPAGFGSGGGGGGFSTARPVAAISIGPDGVHVEPIVDVTKIGLAFFTTLGAMALMWSKIKQASK
ncbi:MAG: hypothetical protein U0559_16225 [Anaerolineae bacterium]